MRHADPVTRAMEYVGNTDENGCWNWLGYKNPKGYGHFHTTGNRGAWAHRFIYEYFKGPIAKGLQLDHLCRNRACVNPEHLEAVTLKENIARGLTGQWQTLKENCPQGHEYTPENTYLCPRGSRKCRACNRLRCRVYWRLRHGK